MKGEIVLCAAIFAAVAATAAEPPPAAAKRAGFETVPKQALVELKATIGKPFTAGLVFIDGKFLAPPYKVERYGTALRINGQQVTGQLIKWDAFLKTQAGAKVERVEAPAGSADTAAAATAPAPAAESDDDLASEFDDLFDDNPKPKKKKKAATAATSRPAAPPAPATTVVFDGEFRPNLKTKAMVDRLNNIRTDLELSLRKGGSCFFSSRYATISADRGPTDIFLSVIPKVMKDCPVFETFSSTARSRGVTFLSDNVMRDLFRNRLDYIRLQDRAKAVKEDRKWESMLNSVN